MKVKVTVMNVSRKLNLNVGQKVLLVHDPESKGFKYDPKILNVLDKGTGDHLGVVGNKIGHTVIEGTKNNEFLFDKMAELGIADANGYMQVEGTVLESGSISFKDSTNRTGFVLEAKLPNAVVKAPVKEFVLTVRGSVKEHKGKTQVLKAIQNGEDINVWLKSNAEDLIAHISNDAGVEVTAGVVSVAQEGSLDEAKAYIQLLTNRNLSQITEVTGASGNNYTLKFSVDAQAFEDVLNGIIVKSFEEVKLDIVNEGVASKETLKSIEKYLKKNNVSEKHIKKVFESMVLYPDDVRSRIPGEPKVKYKDTERIINKSVVYTNLTKHLRLVGEKGVGKNVLTETMAWIYQVPLYEMSLNRDTDKMDILGTKTIESEVNEQGREISKMDFQKESLIQAMENGGFMVLDEVNTADPSSIVVIHPLGDGRDRIEVPGYGLVNAHKNFRLFLTMNRDYIGTSPLNEATRDRFVPILFPTVDSIAKMLAARVPSADPNDIELCDGVYKSIVKVVQTGQLPSDCITNRGFIDALEAAPDLGLFDALVDNVANRIDDEEYRKTVLNFIDDKVGI